MNLYSIYDSQKTWLNYASDVAGATRKFLFKTSGRTHIVGSKMLEANLAVVERLGKDYPRRGWNLKEIMVERARVVIREDVILAKPFCRLIAFKRLTENQDVLKKISSQPNVLIVAPLSGHFSTLLRDTVRTMSLEYNVFITDWEDAREVPLSEGSFGLDTYVNYVQEFIRVLGSDSLHVLAVCQPTVPVLAGVSLMASSGEKIPATLTLMAGPIDARESPTDVCKYALKKPISWFKRNVIHTVPHGYPGEGRSVYPGFLQLFSFMSMNPRKHLEAYAHLWYDVWRERGDSIAKHEDFYNEYNSVLDMDERFYLETVEEVFQKFSLPKGEMVIGGKKVIPGDIKDCRLLVVEGEKDDIAGVGQTFSAHKLCTGVTIKKYLLAAGVGHYGVFSGKKWRERIFPTISNFIKGK